MSRRIKIILIVVIAVGAISAGGAVWALEESKKPAFCANCHIIEPYYESWVDSDYLAHDHQQADVVCKDCHQTYVIEAGQEVVAYVLGNYEDPLKERMFPNEECFPCHEQSIYEEELIQQTINPQELERECYLCHKVHRAINSTAVCLGCHSPFEEVVQASADYVTPAGIEVNPHVTLPHDSDEIVYCLGCHEPHPVHLKSLSPEDVPSADVEFCFACHHTRDFTLCSECHE